MHTPVLRGQVRRYVESKGVRWDDVQSVDLLVARGGTDCDPDEVLVQVRRYLTDMQGHRFLVWGPGGEEVATEMVTLGGLGEMIAYTGPGQTLHDASDSSSVWTKTIAAVDTP